MLCLSLVSFLERPPCAGVEALLPQVSIIAQPLVDLGERVGTPFDFGLGRVIGDWRPVADERAVSRGAGHQGVRGLHEFKVVVAERGVERQRHHIAAGAGRVAVQ